MSVLWLLVGCFVLGVLARAFSGLPADSHRVINAWVIWVSLPALVIKLVHVVPLERALIWSVLAMWLVFALPAGVAVLWARRDPVRRNATAGALALCVGLGNTAFVGYPLLSMLGGPSAVGIGAVADQLGTFVMVSLGAVPLGTYLSGRDVSLRTLLWRLFTFPSMVALVVALATRGIAFAPALDEVLSRLSDMVTPLALASVGWQFEPSALRGNGRLVALGLSLKLMAAPVMVLGFLRLVQSGGGEIERVTVAQAAMAPMVSAGVLASELNLDARLASALIAVGTLLSLGTVPVWWRLLS